MVSSILIVGGGSAGWITAAYLNAVLNRAGRPPVAITLIESPDIGRIGVGEATVPTIRHVLQTIGMDEKTFMRAADATFKQAIRFDDWAYLGDGGYYHPFDRRNTGTLDEAGRAWVGSDRTTSFAHMVSPQPGLCDAGVSPRMLASKDYASPMPYAYHMDAEKFAGALCDWATERGVTHIQDTVTDVQQDGDGAVKSVLTRSGQTLAADLFIDCTGFASVLIGKTLGEPLTDFSQYLLCDRAAAMRVPYDVHDPGHIPPFTRAKALEAGWVWDIALQGRRGRGYVYSSQFLSDEDAQERLRQEEGAHSGQLDVRTLRFPVGYRQNQWSHNVIAVGLASGFIEPLESTGLYLVEYAAVTLAEHFPYDKAAMPVMAKRYNDILGQRYDEILDFVNLHYCLTQRTDTPFWREVARPERITDRLKDKLDFWRHKLPSASDFDDHLRLFSYQSYEHILYGMGWDGGRAKGKSPALPPRQIQAVVEAARTRLPRHKDWLTQDLPPAKRA